MSKYFKMFSSHSDYLTYINSNDAKWPNISFCNDDEELHYNGYLKFEDLEVWRICCTNWGDYIETVITDNGDDTVNITKTFKSNKNTTTVYSEVLKTEINVDNSESTYEVGTTKKPIGISIEQCESVTNMNNAFENNTVITHFNELQYFKNATFSSCFNEATNLVSAIVPSNLTTIAYRMFRNCRNLESVGVLPDTITNIGGAAFNNCNKLHINIPTSLIKVEGYGFAGVKFTGKLVMPLSFNKGDTLWIWGTNLDTLEIPGQLISCDLTFRANSSKKTNVVLRYTGGVNTCSFSYIGCTGNIYVPDNLVDSYKETYTNVADKFKPLSEYTE